MDAFIGTILAFGFYFAPYNWATCSGQYIPISQYSAVFALIGTYYGGNGRTDFRLPDLRSRTASGQGQYTSQDYHKIGSVFGTETTNLTKFELPPHTHAHEYSESGNGGSVSIGVAPVAGKKLVPDADDYIAAPSSGFGSIDTNLYISPASAGGNLTLVSGLDGTLSGFENNALDIKNTGANARINLCQPSQTINYSICMDGIWPSRN